MSRGRPRRWSSPALPRTIRLTARHWEALDLLARAVDSTPSAVVGALIERATVEVGEAIEEMEFDGAGGVAPALPSSTLITSSSDAG